ncbi:MAG: lytic murein transglycosylase [Planktomarina sp.]|nr:lytic murein transglycosylase [Planktomarina sp.]
MTFESWKTDFLRRALDGGVSSEIVNRVSPFLKSNSTVLKADMTQPETQKTLQQYVEMMVSETRISQGQAALLEYAKMFDQIEIKHKVDRHIVAAIWGMETNYGRIRGDVPVLSALSTLAYQGRRRSMFEEQLLAVFEIINQGIKSPNQILGSWAGAMGHTQFMPKSYIKFAVSAVNGEPDIWEDDPTDSLTSTAHFLICHGWTPKIPWGQVVYSSKSEGLGCLLKYDAQWVKDWKSLGVLSKNSNLENYIASLILPGGASSLAFLVSENFNSLLRYNNSPAYAISVGHLADRLQGGPALKFPPGGDPRGLSQSEIKFLQNQLTKLGFDTIGADGFIGPNTKKAIEAYQVAHNLPADGFASISLLKKLQSIL